MDYIYILKTEIDPEMDVVFYVGRSNDPQVRLKQHKAASKKGHEDKYEFIRNELDANNIPWTLEVVREIPDGDYPHDYERFYVIQYARQNQPLQNMKHGDLEKRKEIDEQVADLKIRTVEDVRADRLRREAIKAQNAEKKSEKLLARIKAEEEEELKLQRQRELQEKLNDMKKARDLKSKAEMVASKEAKKRHKREHPEEYFTKEEAEAWLRNKFSYLNKPDTQTTWNNILMVRTKKLIGRNKKEVERMDDERFFVKVMHNNNKNQL